MSRRLGCLTGAGLIAAAVTLLLSLGVIAIFRGQWFSPGPLNAQAGAIALGGVTSHAATGGRCEACHPAPWETATLADRCLACHTAVTDELRDPTSLHGALQGTQAEMACRGCHTEHRGATASLTVLDPTTFPHNAVGYTLAGHVKLADGRPFACADCHTEKLATFDAAVCVDYHRKADPAYIEQHVADFGAACLGCHDGADRYSKRRFDHNRLPFPLTGKHAGARCASCHVNARTAADLQAAPQTCVGCHQQDDKHKGAFGTDCTACHRTDTWAGATFDHSKSAFPLSGKHVDVQCERCHVNQVFKGTPTACVGCHQQDDKHKGAFGTDCTACHRTDTWAGATFDHSKSAFPLSGKHVDVQCERCHVNQVFKGTPTACVGCHQDPAYHLGVFGTACADCHTADAWRPARYNRPHTFPLDHGESGVSPCKTCHPDRSRLTPATAATSTRRPRSRVSISRKGSGISPTA
ncbi:MAG: cytochrome c3 family protein [Anaerolineae bacterium]